MHLDLRGRPRPATPAPRPLTHAVLFKLKEPAPATVAECLRRLRGLEGKIPDLLSVEVGGHPPFRALLRLCPHYPLLQPGGHGALPGAPGACWLWLEYLLTVIAGSVTVDYEVLET